MAGRADFPVDLETALLCHLIEGAEDAVEGEIVVGHRDGLGGLGGRVGCGDEDRRSGDCGCSEPLEHYGFSMGLAVAPATLPPPFSTGSLIEAGSGFGRSRMLSNGRMTMK